MLYEISYTVAEGIPYTSFRDKINIVFKELMKNRHVEIMDEPRIIYSSEKWRGIDE